MSDVLIKERSCRPERCPQGWVCDEWRSAPGEWFCGLCGLPLPPVELSLEPTIGSSARDVTKRRRVDVAAGRTPVTRDADLKDFELTFDITDPDEQSDEMAIPLERGEKAGHMEVDLAGQAGAQFDIRVGLRHKKNSGLSALVLLGTYDYPIPVAQISPYGRIVLPRERSPFSVGLKVDPPGANALRARLKILSTELEGSIERAESRSGLVVRFDPDEKAWKILENVHGTLAADLLVAFTGVQDEVRVSGARVERLTPPRLRTVLAERIRGLTDRRARVAMLIRNIGGCPAKLTQVSWKLVSASGTAVATGTAAEYQDVVLEGQAEHHSELRPLLRDGNGKPLAAGLYQLSVEIGFGDGEAVASESKHTEIEVCGDQEFNGIVCIDFGTTDTAAAIINAGDSYFMEPARGQTPRPLELGRIGLPGRPSRFFLPTRAAIGTSATGKLDIRYADSAIDGIGELNHGRLVDRLKWRLGENERLDGYSEQLSIQDIVVGYLKHVRELIEEHPVVAAKVRRVVATRPAIFGAKTKILIEAFQRAEMEVDLQRFGECAPPLVSESWPPVLFTLPFNEQSGAPPSERLLNSLFEHFPGELKPTLIDAEKLRDVPHFLCTFDIGGGSTDISLLRLQMDGDDQIQIRISDLASHTNEKFAGEGFRDLILNECQGFVPDAASPGDLEGPPRQNLDALRKFASSIQNFPYGPFYPMYSFAELFFYGWAQASAEDRARTLSFLRDTPASAVWPPIGVPKLAQDLIGLRGRLSEITAPYQLDLQTEAGATVSCLFSDGSPDNNVNLTKLLYRIVLRFIAQFDAAINDVFIKLTQRLEAEPRKGPVRVLLTGRGSLFPLAEALVRARAMKFFDIDRSDVYRGSGDSAKAVTSWGGLALDMSRSCTEYLEFTGVGSAGYAIYAPPLISGERPRAALQPLAEDDGAWGAPLSGLANAFARTRVLIVGEGQEDVGKPEELARLEGFNLKAALKASPQGWIVYDSARNTLELRDRASVVELAEVAVGAQR